MGVYVPEWLVLLRQVTQQLHLDEVLQHIGVIAGMEGVAVTQHGS